MKKSNRYFNSSLDPNKRVINFLHEDGEDCEKSTRIMVCKRFCLPRCSEDGNHHCLKVDTEKGIGYIINGKPPNFYAQDVRGIEFYSDNPKFAKKREPPHLAQYLALVDNMWQIKTIRYESPRKEQF